MPVTRYISCRFFQQGHCAKVSQLSMCLQRFCAQQDTCCHDPKHTLLPAFTEVVSDYVHVVCMCLDYLANNKLAVPSVSECRLFVCNVCHVWPKHPICFLAATPCPQHSVLMQGGDCPYSHDNKVEPCKQLVLHGVCRFGTDCHFSHAPLPGYAVGPLQEWFKEQDQLKQDRSDKRAQEQANDSTHHQAASTEDYDRMCGEHGEVGIDFDDAFQDPGNSGRDQQAAGTHDQTLPQGVPCTSGRRHGKAHYRDWADGWQELFAGRLKLKKQKRIVPPDPATFAPLSGPYTSWNDGWKKLFTQSMTPAECGTAAS